MKKNRAVVASALFVVFLASTAYAGLTNPLKKTLPSTPTTGDVAAKVGPTGPLSQIIVYKGDRAGTGTGIISFKLRPGEEMMVTAKGVDKDGKEVSISPSWQSDRELSIKAVEGKQQTAIVKAIKPGAPVFFSATHTTAEGQKTKGEVMGEVK